MTRALADRRLRPRHRRRAGLRPGVLRPRCAVQPLILRQQHLPRLSAV